MGPGRLVRLYYKRGREYDWIIEVLDILRSLPVLRVPQLRLVTWGSHQRMEYGALLVGRRRLWECLQGKLVPPRAGWQ